MADSGDVPWGDIVVALIALATAMWQFFGLREAQRATEVEALETAISSANKRDDALQHAYRARQLRRLQAMHGNFAAAGFQAALWGVLAGFLVLSGFAARDAPFWIRATLGLGVLGSMGLAMKYVGRLLYSIRTKHTETHEAFVVAIANAQARFREDAEKLPAPKSADSIVAQALADSRRRIAERKYDALALGLGIAFILAAARWGPEWFGKRQVSLQQAEDVTCWIVWVCLGLLVAGSRSLWRLVGRAAQGPMRHAIYWGLQLAIVGSALLGRTALLKPFLHWLGTSDSRTTVSDEYAFLATVLATAILVTGRAVYLRVRRSLKKGAGR